MFIRITGHPLVQLTSFYIVLVGSAYFGGPYIFFLWHAIQEVLPYTIFGWMAIAVTLTGICFTGRAAAVLQFIGPTLMVISLIVFILSGDHFMNIYVWRQALPLFTLVLFGFVSGVIVRKFINHGGL